MKHFLKKIKENYFTRKNDTLYFSALKRIVFIFILFIFFLFIAATIWIKFIQKQDSPIKVPRLVGLNILEASEKLQNRKLTLKIIPVLRNDVEKYKVIQQNPAPNSTVRQNRIIELVVSSGQMFSRVPNFTGKSIYTVKQLLLGQKKIQGTGKLILARITYVPSDKAVNTIIAQTPAPDTGITSDMPVTLVVSNGINYKKVKLPNYINKYFEKAIKELNAYNLRVKVNTASSDGSRFGRIISQIPGPGAIVSPADEITLTVARGSSNTLIKAAVINYTITQGTIGQPVNVKIILTDDGNDKIIYQGEGVKGQKLSEAIMIRGSAKYKIYINNNLVVDENIR